MSLEREVKLLQLQVIDALRKSKAKLPSWGQLIGDIRNQKDLMRYFDLKQNLLKSGKNIKTLNGESLLGSGNLIVTGGVGAVEKRHEFIFPYSYCGTASSGSLETDSVWTITRIKVFPNGTTDIKTATTITWTDRLIVIYT